MQERAIEPLAPPAGLYDDFDTWRALTPRLSVRALCGAEALVAEGKRLPGFAPKEPDEPDTLVARPRYVVHARDCLLAGQRAVIDEAAGRLVNDTLLLPAPFFDPATPLSCFPHEFKMTPTLSRDGEQLRLAAQEGPIRRIDEPVIAVSSTEARNYGSWLFRILPKLLTLDRLGPQAADRALLLPLEQPFMREIADIFAPGRRLIAQDVTGLVHLADALVPSLVAPSNVVPALVRQRLAAFADSLSGQGASRFGERLYVSRRRWSETVPRRRLVNEAEVTETLGREGFTEIFPEMLPLSKRIAAFAAARIVVGPTGSGLFNTLFCRPGTQIVELEPHGVFRAMHATLYRSLALHYGFLRGTIVSVGGPPDHPDWQLDITHLAACLPSLLGKVL